MPREIPTRRIATRVSATVVGLVMLSSLASCGNDSGYKLTARFDEAIALFDDSRVLLMGIQVGSVTDIEIDGDGIVVTMTINKDVPIPADAAATILPVSLIGARDIILGPAWKPGDERLAPGSEIENTTIPVEPDEALAAITDLLTSLEPESVERVLNETADALDGNGAKINATVHELAQLVPYLAEQDDELSAIAANLHTLANAVRARDDEIAKLLVDFATVTDVLAVERDQIIAFAENIASLAREGRALLEAYEIKIPETVDTLAEVALTVQANAGSLHDFVISFNAFQHGVIDAYDPERGTVRLRAYVTESVAESLAPLLNQLLGMG